MTAAFKALKAAGFRGAAKRIEDIDIARVASAINVTEDHVHAVIDVESSGGGFDKLGRPKILFEPHVLYRNLSGTRQSLAIARGLAYAKWQPGKYPRDSYPRFTAALEIDETAAIKACSWGLPQILGENYVAAGYASPQDMVVAFAEDEDEHLEALINFLIANKLDDDLREQRWAAFARGYNGPRYAEHGYHTRLVQRFNWWQGKKDTPWPPKKPVEPDPVVPVPVEPPAPKPPPVVLPERSGPVWEAYNKLRIYFGDTFEGEA